MRKGVLSSIQKLLIVLIGLYSFSVLGSEESTYNFSWLDPDKEVYVLQNRKFRKAKSVFLNLGFGKQVSGAFVDSTQFQGRAGYFITENWGITFFYSSSSGSENNTAEAVRANGSVPFRRIMQTYQGGLIQWAPFYSKLNTFNTIFYYDLIFGLGAGTVNLSTNRQEVNTAGATTTTESESYSAIASDVTMKFFINKSWSADLSLTALFYRALNGAIENATGSREITTSHWDATLSIGYTF